MKGMYMLIILASLIVSMKKQDDKLGFIQPRI